MGQQWYAEENKKVPDLKIFPKEAKEDERRW